MEPMDEFCVKCKRKLFVEKVGQEVLELVAPNGSPYKHMTGDVLECPACGLQVVTRFGKVTGAHEKDFSKQVASARQIGCLEVD